MRVPFFVGGDLLKKIVIFLLVLWCMAFNTFARERVDPILEKGEKDDKGVYTSGVVFCTTDLDGVLDYKYQVSGVGLYVVKSADGTNFAIYCSDWMKIHEFFSSDGANYTKSSTYSFDSTLPYAFLNQSDSMKSHFRVSASIPIFIDDENLKDNVSKYLENGDTSGAENKYDVSQPSQDDSVELPTNLRTYGKYGYKQDNAMTVRWDVPTDVNNYTYDVRIKVDYSTKDKDGSTDWYNAVTDYPYERNDQYDLNTGKPISRNTSTPEDFKVNRDVVSSIDFNGDGSYVRTIRAIHVEVRNRLGDKCSNWVSVEAQVDGDNSTNVKDNNGNVVQDDIYNGQNTNNSNHETQYDTDPDFSKEDPKFSLSDFFNYLKSGFGLMGSNGLFAFFQRSFSFIPNDIWTLIIAGVACMIIVGIVNFALKR